MKNSKNKIVIFTVIALSIGILLGYFSSNLIEQYPKINENNVEITTQLISDLCYETHYSSPVQTHCMEYYHDKLATEREWKVGQITSPETISKYNSEYSEVMSGQEGVDRMSEWVESANKEKELRCQVVSRTFYFGSGAEFTEQECGIEYELELLKIINAIYYENIFDKNIVLENFELKKTRIEKIDFVPDYLK